MRIYLYIYGFLVAQICFAQNKNFIRNGGFEDTLSCDPITPGHSSINDIRYWYCPTAGLTGVSHYCNDLLYPQLIDLVKIHSGYGRAGLVIYYDNTSPYTKRNFIATSFLDTLKHGKRYCLDFFTMPSKLGKYGCNSIGSFFGVGYQYYNTTSIPPISPQSNLPLTTVIVDTVHWYHYTDIYIATGGETDIVIGNYTPDINLITPVTNLDPSAISVAYFVIDDVSLHEMSVNIGNDTTVCAGDDFTIGEQNLDTAFNAYYWYHNGVLIDSLQSQKTINLMQADSFVLEKRLPCGTVFDTIHISVLNDCAAQVTTPNVFTPNNDGINDNFELKIKNAELNTFEIYNRWGISVFKSPSQPINKSTIISWDGRTTSGEPCSDGVYYYVVRAKDKKGEEVGKRGYITLIR